MLCFDNALVCSNARANEDRCVIMCPLICSQVDFARDCRLCLQEEPKKA